MSLSFEMRTSNIFKRQSGRRLGSLSQKSHALFSRSTIILVIYLIVLGGFTGYYFLNGSYRAEIVSAASLGEIPPAVTDQVDATLPGPTSTPVPASPTPTPTVTPTKTLLIDPPLPAEMMIEGIEGHRQSLRLSCEARSAVDWAAFFGKDIDEIYFFEGLPEDDNPEIGFVGDVNGSWGQIPPDPYGVHAKPIAQRLREFGLYAKAVRNMTWEELQTELAAGRPVILWVVGHVARGTPVPYTTSGGDVTTVAKFEHTVIAIGYTENKITVVDGAKVYKRHKGEFLKSWGVLENQAVIWIK